MSPIKDCLLFPYVPIQHIFNTHPALDAVLYIGHHLRNTADMVPERHTLYVYCGHNVRENRLWIPLEKVNLKLISNKFENLE